MRIFTSTGEKLYQEWVLRFCATETKGRGEVPFHLLSSDATSTDLGTPTPDSARPFANKYDFITYLKPYIDACLAKVSQKMDEQRRIWDAFALMFFDTICPKDENGAYAPRMFANYLLDCGWRKNERPFDRRHRIFNPYRMIMCNESAMRPFLQADTPSRQGRLEEDLGARQELIGCDSFLELINHLYVVGDKPIDGYIASAVPIDSHRPKWIKKCKSGSLRRLIAKTMQLKNTHDILHCKSSQMLDLLGVEFSDWMKKFH